MPARQVRRDAMKRGRITSLILFQLVIIMLCVVQSGSAMEGWRVVPKFTPSGTIYDIPVSYTHLTLPTN